MVHKTPHHAHSVEKAFSHDNIGKTHLQVKKSQRFISARNVVNL